MSFFPSRYSIGFALSEKMVFYMIWFFNTSGDVAKIADCESLENFLKNVSNGVSFNKIASLCRTNCNSTITKIRHRFFSEYIPKIYISSSTKEVPPRSFFKIALYKILERFLKDIFAIPYLTKFQVDYIGCDFTEKEVFDKNI